MNTVQNGQEKRSIRVKDFLDDFYAGMTDDDLLTKYRLTPTGLERFYEMLQEKGILNPEELATRYAREAAVEEDWDVADGDRSSFICPSCLASHDTMFDICPKCGVSFQELINAEEVDTSQSWKEELLGPETPGHSGDLAVAPQDLKSEPEPANSLLDSDFFGPLPAPESGEFRPAAMAHEPGPDTDCYSPAVDISEIAPGNKPSAGFVDSLDDFDESHLPFAGDLDESHPFPSNGRNCQTCDQEMHPGLRDIYDRNRSHVALVGAGICLVMVLLGSVALSFFDGYSLGRLLVVYITGMLLMFGAIFAGVGVFMLLAREKVYYCAGCKSIYPRA